MLCLGLCQLLFANQRLLFVFVVHLCLPVVGRVCLCEFSLFRSVCTFGSLAARTQATVVCQSSGEVRGQRRRRMMRATPMTESTKRTTSRSPLTCTTEKDTQTILISDLDSIWGLYSSFDICAYSLGWCTMMKHVNNWLPWRKEKK